MRAEEILQSVTARPFEPFRVFVSDGSAHEVRHPEMIMVTRRKVLLARPTAPGVVPETVAITIDPVHITRLERLEVEAG